MTRKIETIVTFCNECKHSRILQEQTGNQLYAVICNYDSEKDTVPPPFLIDTFTDHPKHSNWGIPTECPLEDYHGTSN